MITQRWEILATIGRDLGKERLKLTNLFKFSDRNSR
jgi:hypothetical protein